jgi:hypothetical protein
VVAIGVAPFRSLGCAKEIVVATINLETGNEGTRRGNKGQVSGIRDLG